MKTEKPICLHCGGKRFSQQLALPGVDFAGEHDGKPFTHISIFRVRCKDCGGWSVSRFFTNDKGTASTKCEKVNDANR